MDLRFIGVQNIPMVQPGDDLVVLIEDGLRTMGGEPSRGTTLLS